MRVKTQYNQAKRMHEYHAPSVFWLLAEALKVYMKRPFLRKPKCYQPTGIKGKVTTVSELSCILVN